MPDSAKYVAEARRVPVGRQVGRVTRMIGLSIESRGIAVPLGELCSIDRAGGPLLAEMVGFKDGAAQLMPLGDADGLVPGARVTPLTCRPDGRLQRERARPRARRPRAPDRRQGPDRERDPDAAPPGSAIAARPPPDRHAAAHGGLGDRRVPDDRPRPEDRDLLGIRRRQEHAARRHRPRDARGRQRDRARRRARPRGRRVHRGSPRPRGPREVRGRRRDQRRAAAPADQGREHRGHDRGVLPRPRPGRHVDVRLGHPLRGRDAGSRARARRAADREGLSAVLLQHRAEDRRAPRAVAGRAASPAS